MLGTFLAELQVHLVQSQIGQKATGNIFFFPFQIKVLKSLKRDPKA